MAPHYGHGARRTAHHTTQAHDGAPHHSPSANSTRLGHQGYRTATRRDADRARETQRKRDSHELRLETVIPRSTSPTVQWNCRTRLVDRMTYDQRSEVQDPIDRGGGDGAPPRSQHRRRLQDRITRNDGFSGDGGPVQPISRRRDHRGRAIRTDTDDTSKDMDVDENIDDSYDIFVSDPALNPSASTPRTAWQLVNTTPVQQVSSHHLHFNPHLHPPHAVQPATRPEPIRLLNSWTPHEPASDSLKTSSATEPPPTATAKARAEPKRPVKPYKGGDVVKRLVQNKRLRSLLSDKPMPKPRKAADRMFLKCTGRKEFR